MEWVWRMSNLNVFLSDGITREKAMRNQNESKEILPLSNRTSLKFTNGVIESIEEKRVTLIRVFLKDNLFGAYHKSRREKVKDFLGAKLGRKS